MASMDSELSCSSGALFDYTMPLSASTGHELVRKLNLFSMCWNELTREIYLLKIYFIKRNCFFAHTKISIVSLKINFLSKRLWIIYNLRGMFTHFLSSQKKTYLKNWNLKKWYFSIYVSWCKNLWIFINFKVIGDESSTDTIPKIPKSQCLIWAMKKAIVKEL